MRVALCLMGVILGSVLFSVGYVTGNPLLLLIGFVLLPLAAILGSQPPAEPGHGERGAPTGQLDHASRA